MRRTIRAGVVLSALCSCSVTISAALEFWTASDDDVTSLQTIKESGLAFREALGPTGTAVFCLGLAGSAFVSSIAALTMILWTWAELLHGDSRKTTEPSCESPAGGPIEAARPYARRRSVADAADEAFPLLVDAGPSQGVETVPYHGGADVGTCAACKSLRSEGPPAVLCLVIIVVNACLVLVKDDHSQLWLTVHSQDMDALLLVPALALTLALARSLGLDAYSQTEFRAHLAGAVVITALALFPMLAAIAESLAS